MKAVLITVAVLFLATFAFAEEKTTDNAEYYNQTPFVNQILNNELAHTHAYTDVDTDTVNKYRSPAGVGADIKLYQFGEEAKVLDCIKTEVRQDWNNGSTSVYGVVSVDLTKSFKFLRGGK